MSCEQEERRTLSTKFGRCKVLVLKGNVQAKVEVDLNAKLEVVRHSSKNLGPHCFVNGVIELKKLSRKQNALNDKCKKGV